MKQSTFSAYVANSIKNLLQGYTKGIRLVAVLTLLLTVGIGQVWGAVESGTIYSTASSMPTGWTKDGDYHNNSYLKLVYSTNYIQTDEFCVKSFTSIKLKARKFGGPTAAQALITVEWIVDGSSTVLGTIAPTSTSLTDYTISSPASITSNKEGYVKISCKGAGSGKGSGVSEVTITYTEGSCSDCTPLEMSEVTATAGDRQIQLSWDAVDNASSYTVTCKNKNTGVSAGTVGGVSGSGTKTCTITGLTNGTTYTWSVMPVGDGSTYCAENDPVEGEATPNVYYTVTWMNNGVEYTTTQVAGDSKPTFPNAPESCDATSTTFYGWATATWDGKIDDINGKTIYTSSNDMPEVNDAVTYYAVFAKATTSGGGTEEKDFSFNITKADFNTTSYAANNNEKTSTATATDGSTMDVKWTSYQVMNQSSTMQWQSKKGYIYNSTDLGTIKDITITSTAGTFTKYINDSQQPTSNGTGGYFQIKVGDATGKVSEIIVTFTKTTQGASTTTYSDYTTTCTTCTAPTSVTVTPTNDYGWRYSIGETISLTATAEGGTGDYTYQWQKFIESDWENIEGATSQTYTKTDCGTGDGGTYRCVVSTGDGCSTESDGYWVRVFTLAGNFSNVWNDEAIIWSTEDNQHTIGTVTLTLPADETYEFKVTDNDGRWFGNPGTINTTTDWWGFGVDDDNCTIQTKQAGEYIFTIDVAQAGNAEGAYVNVKVTFPTTQIIYFKPATSGTWADNAKFTIYSWGSGDPSYTPLQDKDCGGIYSAEISTAHTSLLFIKASTYKENFDNITAQTIDLTAPTGDKVLYDMTLPNSTHLFLTPNHWANDGARFAAYFFGNGTRWVDMTKINDKVTGEVTYMCAKPTDTSFSKVIFGRMNPSNSTNDFNTTKWNQSGDLIIPTNGGNLLTVPSGSWDGFTTTWSTVYGDWTTYTPNHTVTFDTNGHGTAPKYQCITDGEKASQPTAPTATGYRFEGWYKDAECTIAWDFANDVVTEDITLYAKWFELFEVRVAANPIAGGTVTINNSEGPIYVDDQDDFAIEATPAAGYRFVNWTSSDESNTHYADDDATNSSTTAMVGASVTITANFVKLHTITWDAAGTTKTQEVDEGQSIGSLPDGTPTSCSSTYTTFVGWYTEASGMETDPSDAPLGTQVTASTVPEGNVTYYAVWADAAAGGGELEKATSLSDGEIIYLALAADGSGVTGANTNNKDATVSSTQSDWMPFTVVGSSESSFKLKNNDNNYVLAGDGKFMLNSESSTDFTLGASSNLLCTISSTEYSFCKNSYQGTYYRFYKTTTITGTNSQYYSYFYVFKAASSATGYISSCCNDPAEVTLTPAATTIYLDADGTAKTTIEASQVGSTNGSWQSASVSRVSGFSEVPTVTLSGTTYTVTATGVGVYNITIGYEETCVKSASVQITVKENPCQLTATGDVHLTSGYTGTAGVAVYTTTAAGNNITVAASNLVTEATKLRVKYLDANGDAIATNSNSRFRLCDATAYTVADNINIAISAPSFSGTYSVSYTPSDYGTGSGEATDTHTLVFEAVNAGGTRVFARCSLQVYGRSLPEEFVIGAQYNGEWFALPADLPTSVANGYASAVDAYPLEVNDAKTSATLAPANARYKVAARNTNDHRGGVRLTAVEQGGYLQAPNSLEENITYLWLPTTNSADHQDWYLTSTDFASYKIQLDPALEYTRFMNMYGGTIGWFANANVGLYLLPITEDQCIAFAEPTLSATYQTTTATVTITPPKFGRIPETYEYSTDQENWTEVTGTTFTVPNLVEGTAYIYYVRGKLNSGTNCSLPASINLACPYIVQPSNVTYYGTTGNAINEVIPITSVNVQNLTATSSNGDIVVELSGSSLTISLSAANATEGTHTTTITLAGDNVNPKSFTVTIIISDLATQAFEWGDEYAGADNGKLCLDQISEETLYLSFVNTLYDEAHAPIVDITNIGTKTFTDLTTGTNIDFTYNGQSIQFEKAALTIGHKYRFAFENEGTLAYSQEGIPYIDCSITFTATNCSTPTATDPCKVTNSGFTANWIEDDDNCLNLNVYTKVEGVSILNQVFTSEGRGPQKSVGSVADPDLWYFNSTVSSALQDGGLKLGSSSKGYTLISPTFSAIGTNSYDYLTLTLTIIPERTDITETEITLRIWDSSTSATVLNNGNLFEGCQYSFISLTFDESNNYTQTIKLLEMSSTYALYITGAEGNNRGLLQSATLTSPSSSTTVSGYPKQVCNATSYEVTGLSANTQYYYTVSDASNTSNEIAVTTLEEAPTVVFEFDLGAANLQAEGACVSEEVVLNGENLPACQLSDISFTITGTDAALFSYETNNLVLIPATGELTGTVTIIYCPEDNLGNHSALLTATVGDTETTLQLIGTNCPTGFSTMATDATNITATSATANWTHATTGYVMFSTNGKVNTNLLLNPGFELGTKEGWNELEKLSTTISTKSKKLGTYSLFVPQSQSSFLVTSTKKAGPVFANKLTLAPGSYTITANVQGAETDASATDYLAGEFYLGFYNGSKVVYCSEEISSTSNKNWQTITANFTITSEITAYPFVAHTNSDGAFFLDDVSLICTSATMGENAIEYPITDATSLDLTGLQPSTSYSYYVVNEYGCESNIITFTTESSDAVPTLSAEDVEIIGPVGKTTNGTFFITATNAYAAIVLTNGCNNSPITLATATVPQTGGVVSFSFTPNETHEVIGSGTCTISMITTGMTNPATVNIHWTVAAGEDPNTPIVEVTDITNTSLTIEHNQTTDPDTEVHIVISRETTDEEAGKNLGDEIFFSKYYEAYSHKKLWAIYNPTENPISLANTYVWRSNGDGDAWSIDIGMDLSQMGNIEPGYIYPNEELIVYTADQVGTCEHEKADMSNWVAMSSSDRALSFSGDDALLLVRQDNPDSTDDDPTTESQEKEKDENGVDIEGTNKELSWRRYHDEETDTYWWMLDIIGARKNNNTPDNSATKNWTCETTGDKGDAEGWVGAQGDDIAGKYPNTYTLSTNRCLLIRKMTVKSGNNATLENVGDMYTLNTEWRGAHVPHSDDQEETSCENFSFVGGYDYDGYYNAWTSLMDINATEATRNDDGSYTADGIEVPRFYCHPLRIEVYITETINGEEIDNVKAYIDYKVPIVVDKDITTANQIYFKYPERTDAATEPDFVKSNERSENILDADICAECDVVIRDGAQLTHVADGGVAEFRNMQVYPTGKLYIPEGSMTFAGLQMHAKNDEVSYAIINKDGSSLTTNEITHVKRIDDKYWYPFSLPYDCKISTIRQLNGKSMGEYGWGKTSAWGIKCYDGYQRQADGKSANAGEVSEYWDKLDASAILKANQGYIIGLFTTEWDGQMKSIYFPALDDVQYTESGNDAKTTHISNWYTDNMATVEARHRGWNFTSLPYISLFGHNNTVDGVNNTSVIMGGNPEDNYATPSAVYVSIPDGGDSRTYTQVSAAATKLEPFKPYFVQAIDPTDGQSHNDITLTYSKGGRTLEKMPARAASSVRPTIVVEMRIANADASLVDNAGVLVSERYTANYEIAADLTKMYAADRKPQLFTRAANNNEMLAYNALPDPLAQNIPLGIYLPNNDEYTISIIDYASQLSDAEAVYLLHNGEIVANLLYADYTIPTQQAGLINGYSLDIRRRQDTPTNIDNIADGGPVITVVDGQIIVQQLPEDAQLHITDVLGRVLYQQANVPQIITFQAPVTGVYNVVITTAEQQFTQKTIVR